MFDPLSPASSPFANKSSVPTEPPWPTTPHTSNSPIPNLRRATSPAPAVSGPSNNGLHGKEPQKYGQADHGLISSRETVSSNGTKYEKREPYLKVRITGLDRNRRDILIKLDAQTNLSNFTESTYRNVSRSYFEFQQFYEAVVQNNPQTIIPALPLAQTSAPTDEEDDRLVKIMLQRWINRVCEDPILYSDEDLRSFIESDFGYQPMPRPKRKASSGFSLIRRGIPDEDEELSRARFELTKLEGQFFEAAKAIDRLSSTRKALATAHAAMGNKVINVATTEAHPPLANALRRLGRTWHSMADLDHAQAISECVIIGDSLGYQGMNARSAKETLLMRTGVLEEYQAAVKTTISKRRQIERLKASSNIRPDRVDEALEEIEEAQKYEQVLAKRAEGISQNLHKALRAHNGFAYDDITAALIEHARSSIMYERQLLLELESLRVDVANADKKVVPSTTAVPRPTVIPPLEDYGDGARSRPAALAPSNNTPSAYTQAPPSLPRGSSDPKSQFVAQTPAQGPGAGSSSTATSSPKASSLSFSSPSLPTGPSHPATNPTRPVVYEAPTTARFGDGSKSMIVQSTSSSLAVVPVPGTRFPSSSSADPLQSDNYGSSYSPLQVSHSRSVSGTGPNSSVPADPLAQVRPHQMTSSMRVQQFTRPRLDPREAASKLANMF